MVENDVDAMWFLPSALNVKVEKFNKARVNGGSNYDSLNVWVMKVYNYILVVLMIRSSCSNILNVQELTTNNVCFTISN